MIEALQSGRADKIAQFSDLVIPDIDKKLLQLQSKLYQKKSEFDEVSEYQGCELSIRLHRMLVDIGQESPLLIPTVKQAVSELPEASMADLIPTILEWLKEVKVGNRDLKDNSQTIDRTKKSNYIKPKDWHTLDSEDLRYRFTQKERDDSFYEHLKDSTSLIFDINDWLPKVS